LILFFFQYYDHSWYKILKAVATAMQSKDPHILAAMDGKETPDPGLSQTRNEPTAFFFVLFGLVYDALATSSTDSTSTNAIQETTVTALEALKCLVCPEYSGKAILDAVIFNEFSSLCYRMAMTESAVVQVHLVEAIAALASSQSSRMVPKFVSFLFRYPMCSPCH